MSRAWKSLAVFFAFVAIYTVSRHTVHSGVTPSTSSTTSVLTSTSTVIDAQTTCLGSDFRGVFNQGQGAAGTIYASVTLKKITTGSCTIKGWPVLTLQDRTGGVLVSTPHNVPDGGAPLTFTDSRANKAPSLVTEFMNSTTSFSLAYSDVPTNAATCPDAVNIAVAFKSGGSVVSVTPSFPVAPCNNGTLWLSPFY